MSAIDISNNGMRHEPVSIAEVLCNTLHDVEVRTHYVLIDIFGLLPDANGDAFRLQEVFTHVLRSEMAHSPVDSTIRLTTFYDSDCVGLAFRDDEAARTSEYDKDLFIAKNLTEAMGGQLRFGTNSGPGTTIEVRLARQAVSHQYDETAV